MEYTKNSNPNYYEENVESANCGSFALNIKEWYNPEAIVISKVDCIDTWILELLEHGYSCDEAADFYVEEIAEAVLSDFPKEIRQINSPSELQPSEELIALRTSCKYEEGEDWMPDFDFHFKVFRDGIWQEKCGSRPVKFCTEDEWTYMVRTYNSYTIYFAHQII